jgi:hypothetical protein
LRPLYPLLPEQWTSRAVRVAMSEADWSRFDALVQAEVPHAPTRARAAGRALSRLLQHASEPEAVPGPLDWMDWEQCKILRLLRPGT